MSRRLHWIVLGSALAVGIGIGVGIAVVRSSTDAGVDPDLGHADARDREPAARSRCARSTPSLPSFTLTDQFGKRVSLRSLRGKVVVLSFNDPECTTICPLTTTAHAPREEAPRAGRAPRSR